MTCPDLLKAILGLKACLENWRDDKIYVYLQLYFKIA